jgi:hypothetical protein
MIRNIRGAALLVALTLPFFLLASCVDCYAGIRIRRNGSGSISLEYRMSAELAALGGQDGNSRWLPVPVGPADFERSAARIEGLRYRSGSTRIRNGESVSRVRLDFASPAALLSFLDGLGSSSFEETGGRRRLTLSLLDGTAPEPAEAALQVALFEGRFIEIRFEFPAAGELRLEDGKGMRVPLPAGWTLDSGKASIFRAPLGDLLLREGDLRLVVEWPAG